MFIIQTNTSLDYDYQPQDFQSLVYQIKNQTWEEFKDYILSEESHTEKIIQGTMQGNTKPRNIKIEEVLINSDHHLEFIISQPYPANLKYYLIEDETFNNFLDNIKK